MGSFLFVVFVRIFVGGVCTTCPANTSASCDSGITLQIWHIWFGTHPDPIKTSPQLRQLSTFVTLPPSITAIF